MKYKKSYFDSIGNAAVIFISIKVKQLLLLSPEEKINSNYLPGNFAPQNQGTRENKFQIRFKNLFESFIPFSLEKLFQRINGLNSVERFLHKN